MLLAADFGDAPLPYPTLISETGAQHEATGPRLGTLRDTEANGVHSANADADGVDEDGVTFGTIRVGQLGATVTVNVQNAPSGAKLDAWIDFDSDGNWGGPSEHIADSLSVVNGNNVITFDVPSSAADGNTFARFRLSTAGNLGFGGTAVDGEVEDYAISIIAPAIASAMFGSPHIISSTADGAQSVYAADIDGDGDMDILSASSTAPSLTNQVAWYENNGAESFTPHIITTDAWGARSVFAGDLDGDGDIDILSASSLDNRIAWYENDGTPAVGAWTPRTITTAASAARSVYAADIDGDGDLDVLSASFNDNKIAWYENDGTPDNGGWTARSITTTASGARSVYAADIDGDGDLDVLSGSAGASKIEWYENDGTPAVGAWSAHAISFGGDVARCVYAADIDGDGDFDVVSAVALLTIDEIAWYENNGAPASGVWSSHPIATRASSDVASSIYVADVDGDGDEDILSASRGNDRLDWYEHDSGAVNDNWNSHTIAAFVDGAYSVYSADVDGDGKLDVLSASLYDDRIAWYENGAALDFGDAPLPYATMSDENGPHHEAIGPRLGLLRDTEFDGIHSLNADADGIDEDGAVFSIVRVGQLGANVTVSVYNAPSGAKLDAWIDFDDDGNWGGPTEQIVDSVVVANGNNVISFDVPSSAAVGVTYARLRLSTHGNLDTGRLPADGEVEDYLVTIAPPVAASGVFGAPQTITSNTNAATCVYASDVDGDGDIDVLSASFGDDKIAWYENNGAENFTARVITITADGAESVYAADLDGDGDIDVISASENDDKIAWYRNNGSQSFTPNTITTGADGASSVYAADVDGDGDLDVLSASFYKDEIAWYENQGAPVFGFLAHPITSAATSADGATDVYAADVDGDGDLDVLSASLHDDKIAWYENDGTPAIGAWTARTVSNVAHGARSVKAADVDGDGDVDVFSASSSDNEITWYENDGDQHFTFHIITTSAELAACVYATDMDGDGDMDVLSASRGDNKVAWYENDGTPAIGAWTEHIVTTTADVPISVYAADVDGDGDLDVLAAPIFAITWYENVDLMIGDYNHDLNVDTADYYFWRGHFGESSGAGLDADGSGNGVVDAADYVVWRKALANAATASSSFAATTTPQEASVPLSNIAASPAVEPIVPAAVTVVSRSVEQSTPVADDVSSIERFSVSANVGPQQVSHNSSQGPRIQVADRIFQQWNSRNINLLAAGRRGISVDEQWPELARRSTESGTDTDSDWQAFENAFSSIL